MSHQHQKPATKNDNKAAPKLEVVDPTVQPEPPATEANSTKKEPEPTRPYTITVPVRVLKLIQIISKTEGVSGSDIWLDAIEKSGLKDRAKAALAALSADLAD